MDYEKQIARTEERIASALDLRAEFSRDPHRPAYHFTPTSAWMNDINGAIFWKGRYHIFYQYNPRGAFWNWMQWGHASSVDLVHWVHHPIALKPTVDGPDRKGCYSGGAFVDKEGTPTFIYYGPPDGVCLASSSDDLLIHWTKHPDNPVIPTPQPGDPDHGHYTIHDPCAWLEGDTYYAAVNRRDPEGKGDGAFLFKSTNLSQWEYVDLFYQSERRWTEPEEDCAVPDFFKLGDKYMLLFCSHLQATQYYTGRLENEKFHPEIHARMSWSGGQLGGARTLLDAQGRRIFFDWVREIRGVERERASGWSGVMTVPRILSLAADNSLRIEPVPELEVLRLNPRTRRDMRLIADAEVELDEVQGDCLELALQMQAEDAREFGVKLRCSAGSEEQTAVVCAPASGKLKVEISRSSLDAEISYPYYRNRSSRAFKKLPEEARFVSAQEAPFELAPGESLDLRVFLDRSILEVFANGRQCITQRIYPTRADSLGVRLFARGGAAKLETLQAWDLAPTHE